MAKPKVDIEEEVTRLQQDAERLGALRRELAEKSFADNLTEVSDTLNSAGLDLRTTGQKLVAAGNLFQEISS